MFEFTSEDVLIGVCFFLFFMTLLGFALAAVIEQRLKTSLRVNENLALMVRDGWITSILHANPERHHSNLNRRLIKIMEEVGESAEAYLNASSANNQKGKTYDDVREELIDGFIVHADCMFTPMPGEEHLTRDQIVAICATILARKLAKWDANRAKMPTALIEDDV